ncbi:MAG: lipopolysaccharide kinase InaA family protein [Planctomycetota bacterium]|jgi:3-deoxy-D-manno-octulosonic acid kinase|nr:lipopolysaccharide kinase InaA family protein [Planctomycetota bacterium]MDP6739819.1 lipopolysaccharide kinase InaA family protein [Planctomycetota bacterium]MDP6939060.1 lipopolysaccharide kinase InaA family protein [Planctomycetota bacterium]
MSSLAVLEDLPSGYFVEETPRGILAVHADSARALHEAGYGPDQDGDLVASELAGRRPLYQFGPAAPPEAQNFLIRRFSHGGLLRWLTGDRFLRADRPFRELILSDALLRMGIQTPRVVAARAIRDRGGWQLDVMTRRVEDSVDLGWVLGAMRRGELAVPARHRMMERLGSLVRELHLHGCPHADLQPGNILVNLSALEDEPPSYWIIDLDRSSRRSELSEGERQTNLARLYRHVARRDEQHGPSLSRSDAARFFRGYDPDGESWRKDWRAVRERHVTVLSWHRMGWLLERVFGGRRPDPRSTGTVEAPAPETR